jgi:arylsulfatase A-like enzyme
MRGTMRLSLRFSLLAAVGMAVVANAQSGASRRPPNFIVILADDQGYGDLGSYGHPTIRTPNIDRLAAEGQRWTSFYAAHVCTPSRAQLMTGRLAVRTGLSSGVLFPDSTGGLQPEEITVAEVLKARGYATTIVGKWHLGVLPQYLPTNQGFDSYFGIPYSNDMDQTGEGLTAEERFQRYMDPRIDYFNVPLMRNGAIVERPAQQSTITRRYTDEGIAFIKAHRERPFFLYLAHNMPHMPLFRSKEFEGHSQRGRYGDAVEEIDANVGRIVAALREMKIDRNTLVLYLSDNGPWAPYLDQAGSAGPLRGAKATTWEGGMRVPAIFWWPGTIRSGVVSGIGSELDVLQTFAGLAGAKPPGDRVLDGYDLSATLRTGAASPRDTLFYYGGRGLAAVRHGPYKAHFIVPGSGATLANPPPAADTAPQLYNLDEDPSERFDLAAKRPEVVNELRRLSDEHRKTVTPVKNQINTRARSGSAAARSVAIVTAIAPGRAARHGVDELQGAFAANGWTVERTLAANACADTQIPRVAEALAVRVGPSGGRPTVTLCGDDRGVMYAALDTAIRVRRARGADNPLRDVHDVVEQPFVKERSLSMYVMNRAYWESRFYDERYWSKYLDMLAADRFNHLLIIFGYENGGFLAPPYPYFFDTPGFPGVKMNDLTPAQQKQNLSALNRLIEMAHDRGIAVALGIWDHIYRGGVQTGGAQWLAEYKGRPIPNTVQGVTAENLNAYTMASLKQLLASVPALDSIQFRVHEESGLKPEEMEGFWRNVFEYVQTQKPGLLMEARAKGTPDSVIDAALAVGVNLRVETKYWMEQMGLPFHPTHVNPPDQKNRRHGYADLLKYPKRYPMNWRLWNGGTSRVLLWGDPEYVRRYSESTQLYDSPNWDVNEPLATKMEAQRPDATPFQLLNPAYRWYEYEFERYWHFYQVWGRVGYNPQTPTDVWDHEFRDRFGDAGPYLASALHRASGVLPMIVAAVYPYRLFPTTRGWAERQSLGSTLAQYATNEGTDVEQFESFAEAAKRIVSQGATAKRTPEMTSRWFDETAIGILTDVGMAEVEYKAQAARLTAREPSLNSKEFQTTLTDLRVLAQLARFHARRSEAAVFYNIFKAGHDPTRLVFAVRQERAAVDAWRKLVDAAGDQYTDNLAMGACNFSLCGHWRDELAVLEKDLAQLEQQLVELGVAHLNLETDRVVWPRLVIAADRVTSAAAGQPLRITARVSPPRGAGAVRLRYRSVTQFDDYQTLEMQPTPDQPGVYTATIPGEALNPKWDFMYFIEVSNAGNGAIWPDLLKETPYVIVKLQR